MLDENALTKYINIREKAEEKAREKIERLNHLIEKWDIKDRKSKEIVLETIMERKMKVEAQNQKRMLAKIRYDKKLKELEDVGLKSYNRHL